jgi:hypothetical protein
MEFFSSVLFLKIAFTVVSAGLMVFGFYCGWQALFGEKPKFEEDWR